MQTFWTFLTGKKSYLIAAATLAYGVANWYLAPRGVDANQTLVAFVAGSGALATLRHGITTSLSPQMATFLDGLAQSILDRVSAAIPPAPPSVVAVAAPGLKDVHDTILAAIGSGTNPAAVTQIATAAVNTAAILTPSATPGA